MKQYLVVLIVVALFCSGMTVTGADPATVLYVAPGGTGNGTEGSPFGTVQEAVTASRSISGAVTILLEEGTYPFTQTLSLTSEDQDLTITTKPGERAVFKGGTDIPYSGFSPVTDQAVLNRIVSYSGKQAVLQMKLSDYGITNYGEIRPQGSLSSPQSGYAPTLTYDDGLLPIACYPNGQMGYLTATQIIKDGSTSTALENSTMKEVQYTINDNRYLNWTQADDIWALAYLCHDWADTTVPATFDVATGVVTSYIGGSYYAVKNRRVKYFNLLEELDAPGEWYLDRNTGILYLIPPEGIGQEDSLQFTSFEQNFISAVSSKNITFRGIHFNGTRKYGAYIDQSDGVVFDRCEFSAIGNAAVYLNKCYRSGVRNSYLHDLGSWGVYMNRCGDRTNLIPGECFVENSEFETFSQYRRTYSPAVHMYEDVGNWVSHCEFHDAPHFAIRYDSNDNIIEYSEFYDLCQETADTGAVYTGRYWNTRGNEIRYCYFHDLNVGSVSTGYGLHGVYLDDASSSTDVHHNIFYKVPSVALMGGGRDNAFTNNMMIDCKAGVTFDARCTTWMAWGEKSGIRVNTDNVANWQTSPAWSKYPNLQNLYSDDPQYPKYNVLENNIMLNTPAFNINSYVSQYGTVRNNVTTTNKAVVSDYDSGNFSPASQAASLAGIPAFTAIEMDQVGVIRAVAATSAPATDRTETRNIYTENYTGFTAQESNGSVSKTSNSVTLTAATVASNGTYSIPRTRMNKDVSIPVFPGRNYRFSMTNRYAPLNGNTSLTFNILSGLIFDKSGFSYSENGGTTWKPVANAEYYYYPPQSQAGSSWSQTYSFDKAMTLQKLFFMAHIPTQVEQTDVWGGGIKYTLDDWSVTELIHYHGLKFSFNQGGSVQYTNKDIDGDNAYQAAPVENTGLVFVEKGTSPVLTITPEEGYQLTSVKTLDGQVIQYDSTSPIQLTVSDVTKSGTISLVFDQVEEFGESPGISEHASYVFGGETREYQNEAGETVSGPVCFVYTSLNNYNYSANSESGFFVSNQAAPRNQLKLSLRNSEGNPMPASPRMQFGIKLFGAAIKEGETYLLTPYVRDEETETSGNTITVETESE